jgi:hypothetical protein
VILRTSHSPELDIRSKKGVTLFAVDEHPMILAFSCLPISPVRSRDSSRRAVRPFFKTIAFLTGVLFTIMLSYATSGAGQQKSRPEQNQESSTYLLAVGCCVPYFQPDPQVCARGVVNFARLFMEKLEVPHKNTRILVNEQATYEKVTDGLSWLSDVAGPEDTVIFYFNGHGLLLEDDDGVEAYGMDEVFVLWSEDEPFSVMYAVATKTWLIDDELGLLIKAIRSRKVVIIADTCHASAAERGLYPRGAIVDYHQGGAALISSARADQVSFFDVDRNMGLFTEELLKAIQDGHPNLEKAFLEARRGVKKRWAACAKRIGMNGYLSGQTPTLTDPLKVTARISFSRATH